MDACPRTGSSGDRCGRRGAGSGPGSRRRDGCAVPGGRRWPWRSARPRLRRAGGRARTRAGSAIRSGQARDGDADGALLGALPDPGEDAGVQRGFVDADGRRGLRRGRVRRVFRRRIRDGSREGEAPLVCGFAAAHAPFHRDRRERRPLGARPRAARVPRPSRRLRHTPSRIRPGTGPGAPGRGHAAGRPIRGVSSRPSSPEAAPSRKLAVSCESHAVPGAGRSAEVVAGSLGGVGTLARLRPVTTNLAVQSGAVPDPKCRLPSFSALCGLLPCGWEHARENWAFYWLEPRSARFTLWFGVGCLASSAYGWLSGTWPFGVVELVWAAVAIHRWWHRRRPSS